MNQRTGFRSHTNANAPRRFSIPKVQRCPSQGCRHILEHESREAEEIIRLLTLRVLDEQYKWEKKWCLDTVCHVINEKLHQKFFAKKKELRQELSKEPPESWAFGVTLGEHEADRICSSGDFSYQRLNVPLGSVDQGVNVCVHPDVLLQWAEKKGFGKLCIVVYKILKGRCKTVQGRRSTKEPLLDPTPNVECHVPCSKPNASEPIFKQLIKSQVFLFEYDDEALPSKHPRHCLPYATVSLTSRLSDTGRSPSAHTMVSTAGPTLGRERHEQSNVKDTETATPTRLDRKRKANRSDCSPLAISPRSSTHLATLPVNSVQSHAKSTVKTESQKRAPSKLLSKCVDGDEKENGIMEMSTKKHEQAPRTSERAGDCARMKLSDRFTNITPAQSKLDNPRLEELRQEHLKALQKLKTVRIERFNNANLSFASSSEDETHTTTKTVRSTKPCVPKGGLPQSKVSDPVLSSESQTVAQRGTRSKDQSLPSESDSNLSKSGFGRLKITITNSRCLPADGQGEMHNHTLSEQSEAQEDTLEQKANLNEKEVSSEYNSKSKYKWFRNDKQRAQSDKGQSSSCIHFEKKQSKEAKQSYSHRTQTSPDKTCKSYQRKKYSKTPQDHFQGRGRSRGRSFSPCRGFFRNRVYSRGRGYYPSRFSCGRGYSQGRGRVRYHCPEYFKSDNTFHVFELEEELYKAASTEPNMERIPMQVKDPSPAKRFEKDALVPDTRQSVDERKVSRDVEHREAPFIRLQSRDYTPSKIIDYGSGVHCSPSPENVFHSPENLRSPATENIQHFIDTSSDDLAAYKNFLNLEAISSGDSEPSALEESGTATNTDNMEVQDMDIDESSRDTCTIQREPIPDNTQWKESYSSASQAYPIQSSVVRSPTSGTQNFSAFESRSYGSTSYNIPFLEKQLVSAGSVSGISSVMTYAPVQEAVNILKQQIQQSATPEEERVLQLALENFLQKCASERDDSCHTHASKLGERETFPVPDKSRNDIPSTYINNKLTFTGGAEYLSSSEVKQENCINSCPSKCSANKEKTNSNIPQKTKPKKYFHGRTLITKGEPLEILEKNIPGQNMPVDPRAALSALFGRKYEVNLKTVSWKTVSSKDGPSKGPKENSSFNEELEDTKVSDKDPRMRKQRDARKLVTPPPCLSCPERKFDQVSPQDDSNKAESKQESKAQNQQCVHADSPTSLFLQKLQHVSCLNIAATRPESSRVAALPHDPGSSSEEAMTERSPSVIPKKLKVGDKLTITIDTEQSFLTETQENGKNLSKGTDRSRRYSNGSSCSSKCSISSSPRGSHEAPSNRRSSPPQRRYEQQGRSPNKCKSPHRSRSYRSRSPHRGKSYSPDRSQHSRHGRTSKRRHTSFFPQNRSRSRSQSPRTERGYRHKSSAGYDNRCSTSNSLRSSPSNDDPACEPEPTEAERHELSGISSELSALSSSIHKAAKKMSHFMTDKEAFSQSCFSCLGQYNTLWLNATKALESLTDGRHSANEHDKSAFQNSIEKYEDIAANVHLQLESLVKYFDSDELDKAGLQDWTFRPLSGVPGLSEREHLTVLHRLEDTYKRKQHADDLFDLVCQKMNFLEKKLRSSVSSHLESQSGSSFPQPVLLGNIQTTPIQLSGIPVVEQQCRHSNIDSSWTEPGIRQIETIISVSNTGSLNQYHALPEQTQDVRRVVLRNIKVEPQRDAEQQGFGTSNTPSQNSDFMQRNI